MKLYTVDYCFEDGSCEQLDVVARCEVEAKTQGYKFAVFAEITKNLKLMKVAECLE